MKKKNVDLLKNILTGVLSYWHRNRLLAKYFLKLANGLIAFEIICSIIWLKLNSVSFWQTFLQIVA